jgi:hypothetical protein
MRITRDIITDLLPVYLSGEASQDTRELVDGFLRDDPEFARMVEAGQDSLLPKEQIHLPKESEMQTLKATRILLGKRSLFLAFGIFFTCLAFAFTFDRSGLHWVWTESPISAIINLALGSWTDASITGIVNLVIGAYFWIRYFQTNRSLKGSAL